MKNEALTWSLAKVARVRRAIHGVPATVRSRGGLVACCQSAAGILRREGLQGVAIRLRRMGHHDADVVDEKGNTVNRYDYATWVKQYDCVDDELRTAIKARIDAIPRRPKISIVMPVFDPPLDYLEQAIKSIKKQIYQEWELCIADDASRSETIRTLLKKYASEDHRIKIVFRSRNGHISQASNSALEIATGEYIALVDNDDTLSEHALFHVVETILDHPDAVVIYSDEDKLDTNGQRIDPYFKCDWNPELFLGHNLISHFGVYRADHVKAVRGFRVGYEGSQDYDLAARVIERIEPRQIVHIPRVLYHWRMLPGSAAMGTDEKPYAVRASAKALNEHLARQGKHATISTLPTGMHRVTFHLPADLPLVSIIVPARNRVELVRACMTSLFERTDYKNFEMLLVDNGSTDAFALDYFNTLRSRNSNVRILRDDRPFNFSALNNMAAKEAKGDLLLLLNNDTEVISPNWLSEMVGIVLQEGIGVVGAKLYHTNGLIQHGGVILGLGAAKVAGHMHHNLPRAHNGYFGRAVLTQQFSAVTAACMLVRKKVYEAVGGFNEELPVAFNDVDFCLKVGEAGHRIIWTPHAELYHHESVSRGHDDSPERQARFNKEAAYMREKWGALLAADPAYSPNLTLSDSDFSLAWPPRIPPMPSHQSGNSPVL